MLENFGRIGEVEENSVNASGAALHHMAKALEHLDSDRAIPAIIGAHLQMAIDVLWKSEFAGSCSPELH